MTLAQIDALVQVEMSINNQAQAQRKRGALPHPKDRQWGNAAELKGLEKRTNG